MDHAPAKVFIVKTGINRGTFFQRVDLRKIKFELIGGDRFYSIQDWNKKCPDRKLTF